MTETPKKPADNGDPYHSTPVSEVIPRLGTDPGLGLSESEALIRLETYGPNQLTTDMGWRRTQRLANQFRDVLILLLVAAAATSGFVLGAWVDAAAIGAIVILNAIIGYAQETKADSALNRLREMEAPEAAVIRGGLTANAAARTLVPGDIIVLEAGDQVPADARLIRGVRLVANEAPLTGESQPVTKTEDQSDRDSLIADRASMLYAGTTVVSGRGRAAVTATGMNTEMGHIATLFSDAQPKTPLQIELARIGRRLAVVAGAAAALIFAAGLARSFPIETMALTAVALAVAAIPEGLPAVVTVSLAGGLQRMARHNAIVRRLPAVEALGAVDIICTDKTGTLTAPELEVGEIQMADRRKGTEVLSAEDQAALWLVASATLCNDAHRTKEGWAGDPTEIALIAAIEDAGTDLGQLMDEHPRLDEAGFDGRRKRMSTVHPFGNGFLLLAKGAPEVLVARSASIASADKIEALTDDGRSRLLGDAENLAERGMRTLAIAIRQLDQRPEDPLEMEEDLTFVGMIGLRERVRPEVPSAVSRAAEAGVRTVMVTGDHATTAAAVADAVGITGGRVMEGHELGAMTVEALTETIGDYRVFARVDPADKVKIIRAWQAAGAKVAMTGDGVNDAPALHRADIGVAMGSGTDVAREAAAMVLTDDNYATIVAAIAEGRRLFGNLRNVVHYLLSANASEVFYVLVGFLFFGFLGEPLLAVQLLWINLISDSLPAIALGMDRPSRDPMLDRPGRGRDVLSRRNLTILLTQGMILAGAAVLAMAAGAFVLDLDHSGVQTMAFTTLVISQLLHALSIRAGSINPASGRASRPGRLLLGGLLGSTFLHMAVVYTGPGNTFFHTVPLGGLALVWSVALSILSMIGVRALKRLVSI